MDRWIGMWMTRLLGLRSRSMAARRLAGYFLWLSGGWMMPSPCSSGSTISRVVSRIAGLGFAGCRQTSAETASVSNDSVAAATQRTVCASVPTAGAGSGLFREGESFLRSPASLDEVAAEVDAMARRTTALPVNEWRAVKFAESLGPGTRLCWVRFRVPRTRFQVGFRCLISSGFQAGIPKSARIRRYHLQTGTSVRTVKPIRNWNPELVLVPIK